MIKSRNLDYFHYQISEHNITDHEIIEISYKIDATDFDVKNSRRLYTKKHINKFIENVKRINFETLFATKNANQQLHSLISTLKEKHDTIFPIIENTKIYKNPWMNKIIINLINHKNFIYKKYKKHPTNSNKNKLRKTRQELRRQINKRKAEYYELIFKSVNQKNIWKMINNITNSKSKIKCIETIKQGANTILTEPLQIAEEFSKHFQRYYSCLNMMERDISHKYSISENLVEIEDVKKYMNELKNKYTKTRNDIPLMLWKHLHNIISPILTHIINSSFKESTFPEAIKICEITPVFKKENPLETSNYRPIAILPNVSKIFEKAILEKVNKFIKTENILPECQYGFRKFRSTKDAMLDLRLKLESINNQKRKCCLIMLDLSKAFDKVNHKILIEKMKNLRFPISLVNYISSYLNDRMFCTKIKNTYSNYYECHSGVPQGSILSPTLYSIYVHDFESKINEYTIQYADDTSIIIDYTCLKELNSKLTKLHNEIYKYLDALELQLNGNKTEIIVFNEKEEITLEFGTKITTKTSAKFLGITINKDMTFKENTIKLINKISRVTRLFYSIKNSLPKNIKKIIYYNAIYSRLIYNSPFLFSDKQHEDKLEKMHKKLIKILFNYNKKESTKRIYENTNLKSTYEINSRELIRIAEKIKTKNIGIKILHHFRESKLKSERYILTSTNHKYSLINELVKTLNNYQT